MNSAAIGEGRCRRYGVPASDANKLEDTVMERIYADALKELKSRERCPPDVLRRTAISTLLNKTTMFSPKVLLDAGAHLERPVRCKPLASKR